MLIEERINALYSPYRDCAAAIDGARVLAKITGTPHMLYREFGDPARWHVRGVDDLYQGDWVPTGGIFLPDDTRSNVGQDAGFTPERAAERGLLEPTDFSALADEYRRFVVGGPARTFHE